MALYFTLDPLQTSVLHFKLQKPGLDDVIKNETNCFKYCILLIKIKN